MDKKELLMCIYKINNKLDEEKDYLLCYHILKSTNAMDMKQLQPLLIATLFRAINEEITLRESCKEIICNCLAIVFDKSKVDNRNLFFNILGFLLKEMYEPQHTTMLKSISEEYKLSLLICIRKLLASQTDELLRDFYNEKHLPQFSIIVSVALNAAKYEKLRKLRLSGLECIDTLATLQCGQSEVVRKIFVNFLPGIASGITVMCNNDRKLGAPLLKAALCTWCRIVALVMRETNQSHTIYDDIMQLDVVATYSIKWYQQNDAKLANCVDQFVNIVLQTDVFDLSDRVDLVMEEVMMKCWKNIPLTIIKLIELQNAVNADYVNCLLFDEIHSRCDVADDYRLKLFFDMVEESFYKRLNDFAHLLEAHLDLKKLYLSYTIINHQLDLFNKTKLRTILLLPSNLQRIMYCFIQFIQLSCEQVEVLEDFALEDIKESEFGYKQAWKSFLLIDSAYEKKMQATCKRIFAQPIIIDIVFDYLFNLFDSDAENRKEITCIINYILAAGDRSVENFHYIERAINVYLENWNLPLSCSQGVTLKQAKSNILQICVQLEGFGMMALACGLAFKKFLLKTLYIILEKAGGGNRCLREAALIALREISIGCGYENVAHLIHANVDYISFNVERRLKMERYNEGVLNVLGIVLNKSEMNILSPVSHIMQKLMEAVDKQTNVSGYLRVFYVFIGCLYRWLHINVDTDQIRVRNVENCVIDEDVDEETLNESDEEEAFNKDMKKTLGEVENDILHPECEDERYRSPEPPLHIKLAIAILKRSLNFLGAKDIQRKCLILNILADGMELLYEWEDELLPLVHKIWSPLIERFNVNESPLVIAKSFALLLNLARLSGDFIRIRTMKEALPSMVDILQKYARIENASNKTIAMQLLMVSKLHLLLINTEMGDDGVLLASRGVIPYLHPKFSCQSNAQEFFVLILQHFGNVDVAIRKELSEYVQNLHEEDEKKKFHSAINKIFNNIPLVK